MVLVACSYTPFSLSLSLSLYIYVQIYASVLGKRIEVKIMITHIAEPSYITTLHLATCIPDISYL